VGWREREGEGWIRGRGWRVFWVYTCYDMGTRIIKCAFVGNGEHEVSLIIGEEGKRKQVSNTRECAGYEREHNN